MATGKLKIWAEISVATVLGRLKFKACQVKRRLNNILKMVEEREVENWSIKII